MSHFSHLRSSVAGRILIHSYTALELLLVSFLIGAVASFTNSDVFCGLSAGLFHYFSVVYMFWVFAEALFYMLRLKMNIGGDFYTRHYVLISGLFCWSKLLVCDSNIE